MNRIKVLALIKGLGGAGGAERLLATSLRYLDRDRFEYEVSYLLSWKDVLVPEFQRANIPVFCLNLNKAFDVRIIPRIARLLRERQVDILHIHSPFAGIVGRIASRLAPATTVIYTEHNLWERYHWLTRPANRMTYRWNDAVIAVSQEVERSIRSNYTANASLKLRTIPNGVDTEQLAKVSRDARGVKDEFRVPPENRLVVNVASFTSKKRHVDLLRGAKEILKQDPSVTFLLVGQGPLQLDMKLEARQLGIDSNVIFTGFRPDVPRLVAAADLFVLSSLFEGLPISLLEAMGLGIPVVATRVGGIPEAVTDGVEGFLVEPLNPSQLADKVLELLHSPELLEQFSQNAARRIQEDFPLSKMVECTEDLYTQVLDEKAVA